jgi:hypothetical protein
MKNKFLLLLLAFSTFSLSAAEKNAGDVAPQFTSDGKLLFPKNYREWVFLSSGLGMTYGPAAANSEADHPRFDNVFVARPAYDAFLTSGKWPDKTIFVLEIRSSESKGSINKDGHFQGDIVGIEAEVKDEARFSNDPKKWRFFGFNDRPASAPSFPASATCYACHSKNAAVDNTFVQFYPSLRKIAQEKGTFKTAVQ